MDGMGGRSGCRGGEGVWKAKLVEKSLERQSHLSPAFAPGFGCPPEWFRKGKRDRHRGLVSGVLQMIDIPQLKLSTLAGGRGHSKAGKQLALHWGRSHQP